MRSGGPYRVICGFPIGTGGDTICRFFARQLEPLLGAAVTVENIMEAEHEGYEGNLATRHVLAAPRNGHAIYLTAGAILVANQALQRHPAFDVGTALTSIGTMTRVPNTIVVAANSPYRTLADLTAAMKVKGAAARYGVPNGSVVRVIGALYRYHAGLRAHEMVRRQSRDVFSDLEEGKVDYAFSNNWYSVQQEQAGRVRILAMSLRDRLQAAPQYPTFTENGLPIDVDGWWGGYVAAGTPRPVVERLAAALRTVVSSEECRKFFNGIICDPWPGTPRLGQAHLREQLVAWRRYVDIAGLEKEG
nr:tripartite tricarboxylate transporter substrate binding protein [Novosphingobium flavum]